MNAVGIDVSKGKSTVAIMQPLGVVVKTPYAAYKRLPLEGKLSAARLTDEVSFLVYSRVIRPRRLKMSAHTPSKFWLTSPLEYRTTVIPSWFNV